MNNKHKIFIGSILFIVLVLGGYAFLQERIISTGTEVLLKTRPIDPRDLLRGEYVVLRYEIENDERVREEINRNGNLTDGSPLFVRLTTDSNQLGTIAEVRVQKPDFSNGLWIRGEISRNGIRFPSLEQYFVPEGMGKPIERIRNDVYVKARILNGEARIVGLVDTDLKDIDIYDYQEEGSN